MLMKTEIGGDCLLYINHPCALCVLANSFNLIICCRNVLIGITTDEMEILPEVNSGRQQNHFLLMWFQVFLRRAETSPATRVIFFFLLLF